jgi:hypothetical protein
MRCEQRETILAMLAYLILAGCNGPQPGQSKQQASPAVETALAPDDPSQPRLATLAQQKVCAEQAEKQFNSTSASQGSAEFTSHYDARANVCYIMVHDARVSYGNPTVSVVVYDAFEGRVYANYMWINSQKKKYWEVAPMECDVKPRGQPEIVCKSSDEFEELIDKYFGIGR